MQATRFEYSYRYAIHGLLFFLGFAFYWIPGARESTWLTLTFWLDRTGWLGMSTSTNALLILAILVATLGALLRTWGTAYLGSNIVQSHAMHGNSVLADGPYRRTRNPLYLGTFLHTLALALLTSPYGALFIIATIGLLQLRLIFAEEPFLAQKIGVPYLDYCKLVPRIVPSLIPRVAASGQRPHWLQAVLGEIYMIGVALSFAIFGWRYNAFLLTKCVVIALGASLIVRALRPNRDQAT